MSDLVKFFFEKIDRAFVRAAKPDALEARPAAVGNELTESIRNVPDSILFDRMMSINPDIRLEFAVSARLPFKNIWSLQVFARDTVVTVERQSTASEMDGVAGVFSDLSRFPQYLISAILAQAFALAVSIIS